MASPSISDGIDPAIVDQLIRDIGDQPKHIVPLLLALQRRFHHVPETALRRIAETTEISLADLVSAATYYSFFRLRPAGKHLIKTCVGTACHVQGAERVLDQFKRHLGISQCEDTDAAGQFTVESVACLGCCMLAPVVQIDDITYGHVQPQQVPAILNDFLSSVEKSQATGDDTPLPHGMGGTVRLCLCSSCSAAGSTAVFQEAQKTIKALHLPLQAHAVGCTGISYQAPLLEVAMNDGRVYRYGKVREEVVQSILLHHVKPQGLGNRIRAGIHRSLSTLFSDENWEGVTRYLIDTEHGPDASFMKPQTRLITQTSGTLDPLDLSAYEQSGGWKALNLCETLDSEAVIQQIKQSGLRGRGGGGFPTGEKWSRVKEAPGDRRVIICNGDEGDPGAFMDRLILESFPFMVIEGMLIASHAVGAQKGYLFIRAEYPKATQTMRKAILACQHRGLLGTDADDDTGLLYLEVVEGAGAFVCGEETALIHAIEGGRATPRFRPPFPAVKGLWGLPTLVNNVETYALVPYILRHGAESVSSLGTATSKGSKMFALAGKVNRGGLVEVPMGMTIRQVVDEIGGGIQDQAALKAVLIGGPSGGCVPASASDTPIDYESLNALGSMMGSGGLVVLDERDCMVDIARYFTSFVQAESCGKCAPCRIGTKRMLDILDGLCAGKGRPGDLEELERVGTLLKETSLCGLGRTAPNPTLSALTHFREEFEAHVQGHCPALKCTAMIGYQITDRCIGCTLCSQKCPTQAIEWTPYQQHIIDQDLCIRCDVCRQTCPEHAIEVVQT